jgi:hypothetical protein
LVRWSSFGREVFLTGRHAGRSKDSIESETFHDPSSSSDPCQ